MTELAERIRREIDEGKSLRQIGDAAGLAANTVRRVRDDKDVDHKTMEKLAAYFRLPIDELYRMAGILPPMYIDGHINRSWLLEKLWDVLSRLEEEDQALVLAEAIRISKKHNPPNEQTNP